MKNIYSYVLRQDDGAAPNPYGGICTLAICKPVIRRVASIGDWVIGTGSKNSFCNDAKKYDFSSHIVYAMKITDIKTIEEYNHYCVQHLSIKVPYKNKNKWQTIVGDCIYDFPLQGTPVLRESVHNEHEIAKDLSGLKVLLSNHFYYFGGEAILLPTKLLDLIKRNQGHKTLKDKDIIKCFEEWINQFIRNKIYADPQMMEQTKKRHLNMAQSFGCNTSIW